MNRVVYQAASLCLQYPSAELVAHGPLIRAALSESASRLAPQFSGLLDTWLQVPLGDLQTRYVEVFDLSRKHTLYLTYWSDGDTRRRGASLHAIKQRYREAGFLVDTHGELPDYLPMVLEFAAAVDPAAGAELLQSFRSGLELLRLGLTERAPEHAGVLTAICATLPGPSPADRREAQRLAATGPGIELVGLEPHDPRLLPLGAVR